MRSLTVLPLVLGLFAIATDAREHSPQTGPVDSLPRSFHKKLSGRIGEKLHIHMDLTRNGKRLGGTYYYESVGSDIGLEGTVGDDGRLTLKESSGGKETGLFRGEISFRGGEPALLKLEGTWSKPGDSASKPFFAIEDDPQLPSGIRLVCKSIVKKGGKSGSIEVTLPQITGSDAAGIMGFNQAAQAFVAKITAVEADEADQLVVDYDYDFISKDIVSAAFIVWSYSAGAAHGNYHTTVLNYDLNARRSFGLPDLFKPGSNYLQRISRFCIAQLKEILVEPIDEEWITKGAAADPDNYREFGIQWDGLLVRFSPYQVAPYAAGEQEVLIPYAELKDVLAPNSPIQSVIAANR